MTEPVTVVIPGDPQGKASFAFLTSREGGVVILNVMAGKEEIRRYEISSEQLRNILLDGLSMLFRGPNAEIS